MQEIGLILGFLTLLWAGVLVYHATSLIRVWREPVLRAPVLIIESDDWGAGPLEQVDALRRLATLLKRYRDCSGRPALMTLGVILEVPDGPRIAATGCSEYHALPFASSHFEAIRAAMHDGMAAGVFVPQLHGQCHYWPPALLASAKTDDRVRGWLTVPAPAATESLPSPLQSRWVDAAVLPSRALDKAAIEQTVVHEAAEFGAIFGSVPEVAVATTFVWNDTVENAWRKAGVEVVITPGHRATCRDAAGAPGCVDRIMVAGERSHAGQTYLVRDVYFEPALGHPPQRLVDGLAVRTREGRACLVETHRFNFLKADEASLAALESALQAALAGFPRLRFLSPSELARAIRSRDPEWIETRLDLRLAAWRERLDEIPHFGRIAQLTGLALPLALLRRAK